MHISSKSFDFSRAFTEFYLSSDSVFAQTGGRGLLSKKWTGMEKGREGIENWQKCAGSLYG